MATVEYRVYVRFESSPREARRNVEEARGDENGPALLESTLSAEPGDEGPILQAAMEEARLNGKYVALYRGQPVGHDRRGHDLFVPVGLAWCKDSEELALMISGAPQRPESSTAPHQSRYQEAQRWYAEKKQASPSDGVSGSGKKESRRDTSDSLENTLTDRFEIQPGQSHKLNFTEDSREDDYELEPEELDRREYSRRNSRGRAEDEAAGMGWLAWTGIFVGSFVAAFVIVYGLATLLGH